MLLLMGAMAILVAGQNAPPVADAGGPYIGSEGTPITFDASASSDPDGDPLNYTWDLDGDGLFDTVLSPDPTAERTWNNQYIGFVTVLVWDGHVNVTDTTNVTILNVAPVVEAGDPITIDEGDTWCIPGDDPMEFFDPGIFDWFTIIYAFDRPEDMMSVAGDMPHKVRPQIVLNSVTYSSPTLDCTILTNDYYLTKVMLVEHQGTITEVKVGTDPATPPTTPTSHTHVFPAPQPPSTNIPLVVVIEPDENDLWTLQWHLYGKESADPSVPEEELTIGTFSNNTLITACKEPWPDECGIEHHFVNITVMDLDGGIGFDLIDVTVNNVAPTVVAGEDLTVSAGDEVQFTGVFDDPGWLDTHVIVWDFGDGASAQDTLTPTHTYNAGGSYNVTLTVTDDNGGTGTDGFQVLVRDLSVAVDLDIPKPKVDQKVRISADLLNLAGFDYPITVVIKVDGVVEFNETHDLKADGSGEAPTWVWKPKKERTYEVEVTVTADGKELASATEKVKVKEDSPSISVAFVIIGLVIMAVALDRVRGVRD
jgi:hypothetical protein